MSLTVEDGSVVSGAESYCSVADADTYHAAFTGSTSWSGATTARKEIALRRATQYLDMTFGGRWKGDRYDDAQALDWPRECVEIDGVLLDPAPLPQLLMQACAELALRDITETAGLLPDDKTGGVAAESTTVDVITTSKTYVGAKETAPRFAIVDRLVAKLTYSANRAVRQ